MLQLTIEWEPQCFRKDTVDHYEQTRIPRREYNDLKVRPIQRQLYLGRIVGATAGEISRAARTAEECRRQRMETVRDLKNEKLNIFLESAKRKTFRILQKTIHPLKVASNTLATGGVSATGSDKSVPSSTVSSSSSRPPRESRATTPRRPVTSFHGGVPTGNHSPKISAMEHRRTKSSVN